MIHQNIEQQANTGMKSQLDLAREALESNPTEANARRCERLLELAKVAELPRPSALSERGQQFMKQHGVSQ